MRSISFVDGYESGSAPTTGAVTLGPAGSAAAPAFGFSADSDTGIFRKGANALGFSTGGTEAGSIGSSQAWVIGRSTSAEIHTVHGDFRVNSPTASSIRAIYRDSTTGALSIQGDNGASLSAVTVYAKLHASKPGRVEITADGTVVGYWDVSGHLNTVGQRAVRFQDSTGGEYVGLRAPATVPASVTFDLPSADGTAGHFLKTNGSGVLSFGAQSAVLAVADKTTTYTATSNDDLIRCDASGGAFTITLPAAASNAGKTLYFKKIDSSFNAVTLDGNASETIDGSTTTSLNTQYEMVALVCNGTSWDIRDRAINQKTTAYTPTGSWSTNTTYTGFWQRVGDSIEIDVKVATSGAPTSASLTVNIPSGLTIDTAKILETTAYVNVLGNAAIRDTGTAVFQGSVWYESSTSVRVQVCKSDTTNLTLADVTQAVPMTFASGDSVNFKARFPISGWNG